MDKKVCLLLAGLVAMAAGDAMTPARAAQLTAMVEAVQGGSPEVGELEPLEDGQVIALGADDRIVIGYLDSCTRETIQGPGVIRIGAQVSSINGAELVERRTIDCRGTPMEGLGSGNGAAVVVRGLKPRTAQAAPSSAPPEQALVAMRTMRDRQSPARATHRQPVLLLDDPSQQVVLQPLDGQGKSRSLRASTALVDISERTGPLEPGLWVARRGSAAVTFIVPAGASDRPAGRSARLLRF